MEKIKILEKKKLKLINVLTKELRNADVEDLDKEIKKITNFLSVSKIQTRGPLIIRTLGSNIDGNGDFTFDYDIMIQTVRNIKLPEFTFFNEFVVGNCLYIHYEGNQDEFSYAQSKMDLYIWENDLIDTGEEIIVYIKNEEYGLIADIFKPIVY